MKPSAYSFRSSTSPADECSAKVICIQTIEHACHAHNCPTTPASHPALPRVPLSGITKAKLLLCGMAVLGIILIAAWPAWKSRWLQSATLLLSGTLCWTFLEYSIHRFFTHRFATHHGAAATECGRYPVRNRRFQIIALWFVVMAASFALHRLMFIVAGIIAGWIWFCYMRVFAQWRGMAKFFPALYRQYLYHQAGGHDKGYGWTTTLWDQIFNTHVPCGYIYSNRMGKTESMDEG